QMKADPVVVVPNRSSSRAMFSLTSRNKASLRAARCSQSVTTKHEVSRYRRVGTARCDLTMATRVEDANTSGRRSGLGGPRGQRPDRREGGTAQFRLARGDDVRVQ